MIPIEEVRKAMGDDPAHDFLHALRVWKLAKIIGDQEGADMEILLPAALLHDLSSSKKNHGERISSAGKSADISRKILQRNRFSEDSISKITYAINVHSYSKGIAPETLEAKILL